jgi:hypothetical protein
MRPAQHDVADHRLIERAAPGVPSVLDGLEKVDGEAGLDQRPDGRLAKPNIVLDQQGAHGRQKL